MMVVMVNIYIYILPSERSDIIESVANILMGVTEMKKTDATLVLQETVNYSKLQFDFNYLCIYVTYSCICLVVLGMKLVTRAEMEVSPKMRLEYGTIIFIASVPL